VGEVKRRKGYHITIEAVAQLKHEFPALRYAIVGDTGDRKYAESLRQRRSIRAWPSRGSVWPTSKPEHTGYQ
jgi:glycosyltransferase involved in cell wall biosynthesis